MNARVLWCVRACACLPAVRACARACVFEIPISTDSVREIRSETESESERGGERKSAWVHRKQTTVGVGDSSQVCAKQPGSTDVGAYPLPLAETSLPFHTSTYYLESTNIHHTRTYRHMYTCVCYPERG
jgi:hypothetical protein